VGAFGGSPAEVARERQLEPSTEAVSEHRDDHGLVQVLDQGQDTQPLIEHRLESTTSLRAHHQLFEVHTDAEVVVSGRGDHNRPHLAIVPQGHHGTFDLREFAGCPARSTAGPAAPTRVGSHCR